MSYSTSEQSLESKKKIAEIIKDDFDLSPYPVVALFRSEEVVGIYLLYRTEGGNFVQCQYDLGALRFKDTDVDNTAVPVKYKEMSGRPNFVDAEGNLYQPIVV